MGGPLGSSMELSVVDVQQGGVTRTGSVSEGVLVMLLWTSPQIRSTYRAWAVLPIAWGEKLS